MHPQDEMKWNRNPDAQQLHIQTRAELVAKPRLGLPLLGLPLLLRDENLCDLVSNDYND